MFRYSILCVSALISDNCTNSSKLFGPVGSILVEFKREQENNLIPGKRRLYGDNKLFPYMKSVNAKYGIILIFKDDADYHKTIPFEKFIDSIKESL